MKLCCIFQRESLYKTRQSILKNGRMKGSRPLSTNWRTIDNCSFSWMESHSKCIFPADYSTAIIHDLFFYFFKETWRAWGLGITLRRIKLRMEDNCDQNTFPYDILNDLIEIYFIEKIWNSKKSLHIVWLCIIIMSWDHLIRLSGYKILLACFYVES